MPNKSYVPSSAPLFAIALSFSSIVATYVYLHHWSSIPGQDAVAMTSSEYPASALALAE